MFVYVIEWQMKVQRQGKQYVLASSEKISWSSPNFELDFKK